MFHTARLHGEPGAKLNATVGLKLLTVFEMVEKAPLLYPLNIEYDHLNTCFNKAFSAVVVFRCFTFANNVQKVSICRNNVSKSEYSGTLTPYL